MGFDSNGFTHLEIDQASQPAQGHYNDLPADHRTTATMLVLLKAVSKVSRFGIEMNVEHENSYLPEDLLFHCIT